VKRGVLGRGFGFNPGIGSREKRKKIPGCSPTRTKSITCSGKGENSLALHGFKQKRKGTLSKEKKKKKTQMNPLSARRCLPVRGMTKREGHQHSRRLRGVTSYPRRKRRVKGTYPWFRGVGKKRRKDKT